MPTELLDADHRAFQAFYVIFTVFTIITNLLMLIALVVRICLTRCTRRASPKLVTVVVSCVANLSLALFPHIMGLRLNLGEEFFYSCRGLLVLEVSFNMLSTLSLLVVAVVILTEVLKLQPLFKTMLKRQMAVTVVLLLMAAVYDSVVIPIVFFRVVLENANNPCNEYGFVAFNRDRSTWRVMPAVAFLLPFLAILLSTGLLVLAYVIKACRISLPVHQGACADTEMAVADHNSTQRGNTAIFSINHSNDMPYSTGDNFTHLPGKSRFPADMLLAAVVMIIGHFLIFFRGFVLWDVDLQMEWASHWKLWAAGILLQVLSLALVPCCWLVDPSIRAAVCRCGRQARAVYTENTREEIRQDGTDTDVNPLL